MNPPKTACLDVTLSPSSSPAPLFTTADFAPLPDRASSPTTLTKSNPSTSNHHPTALPQGHDWHSPATAAAIDQLHAAVSYGAELAASTTLALCRSSAAAEVDASAADLFAPLIHPFPKNQRLIQCSACRRPLLLTRLFQHLPHCPARHAHPTTNNHSHSDSMLDLIAAPYAVSPPRVRKRPRTSAPPTDVKLRASVNVNKAKHAPAKIAHPVVIVPTKYRSYANHLHTPPTESDRRFTPPRDEDDWRSTLVPIAPPSKPISKYRRRRVHLPPPYEPHVRKRTPAIEKKALLAAAGYVQNIPARSPTAQHIANSRDPLRNAVTTAASSFPWAKIIQLALPIPSARSPKTKLGSVATVANKNSNSTNAKNSNINNESTASNGSRKAGSNGSKDSTAGAVQNGAMIPGGAPNGGRITPGNGPFTSSPPLTPRPSNSSVDSLDLDAMATSHPVPSLAAALLYLRGQGLRPLAHTTLASVDPPTQPLIRPAPSPFFHGQRLVAELGSFKTDLISAPRNFKLPDVASPLAIPAPQQPPQSIQHPQNIPTQQPQQHPPQQANQPANVQPQQHPGSRSVPTDPRMKASNTMNNPSHINNSNNQTNSSNSNVNNNSTINNNNSGNNNNNNTNKINSMNNNNNNNNNNNSNNNSNSNINVHMQGGNESMMIPPNGGVNAMNGQGGPGPSGWQPGVPGRPNMNLASPSNNISPALPNSNNTNLAGLPPGTAAALLKNGGNMNNPNGTGTPNSAVGMNALPPGVQSINLPGAMNPQQHTMNAMKGMGPSSSNADATSMSQHSGYGNSTNLPPPSPSTSIGSGRRSRPRAPSTPSGGLPADLAMAGVKPMSGVRKAGGNRKIPINKANVTATAALMNSQQPSRMQSPASGKLMRNTPTTDPPMIGVTLGPPAHNPSAPYNPNMLPQQVQQQKKKPYRSPGRVNSVSPRYAPGSHPIPIPGPDMSGMGMVGGNNQAQHLMQGRQGAMSAKARQQHQQIGMLSPGMGPNASQMAPQPAGKTAVKSPSPSQGSIRSGDLSSLQARASTGTSNPSYDAVALTSALGVSAPMSAGNVVGGGSSMTVRPENSAASNTAAVIATKELFTKELLMAEAARTGKNAIRPNQLPTGPGSVPNVNASNMAVKSPGGGVPGVVPGAYMGDGSVNPIHNSQGLHGVSGAIDNQALTNTSGANSRLNESSMLMSTPGLRPTAAVKAMSRNRLGPVGRKDGSVNESDLGTQLRQAHGENMHMDGSGDVNMNNMQNMRLAQNVAGHAGNVPHGYYNGVPQTSAQQNVTPSPPQTNAQVPPHLGPSPQHRPQAPTQPNSSLAMKGHPNTSTAAKFAMIGLAQQGGGDSVPNAVVGAQAQNGQNSGMLQGMNGSFNQIPGQLMGTSGLPVDNAAAVLMAAQNRGMVNMFQNSGMSAGMQTNLMAPGGNMNGNSGLGAVRPSASQGQSNMLPVEFMQMMQSGAVGSRPMAPPNANANTMAMSTGMNGLPLAGPMQQQAPTTVNASNGMGLPGAGLNQGAGAQFELNNRNPLMMNDHGNAPGAALTGQNFSGGAEQTRTFEFDETDLIDVSAPPG